MEYYDNLAQSYVIVGCKTAKLSTLKLFSIFNCIGKGYNYDVAQASNRNMQTYRRVCHESLNFHGVNQKIKKQFCNKSWDAVGIKSKSQAHPVIQLFKHFLTLTFSVLL